MSGCESSKWHLSGPTADVIRRGRARVREALAPNLMESL
jgi:hypothetical protein